MRNRTRTGLTGIAVTSLAIVTTLALAAPAAGYTSAHGSGGTKDPITVIASGLNGPRQLTDGRGWRGEPIYVAESDSGQVTRIDRRTGGTTPVVTGVGEGLLQGVAVVGDRFALATGGAEDLPPEAAAIAMSLLVAKPGKPATRLADLLAYELTNNPDGQDQSVDTVSNPYYVLDDRRWGGYALVADAGANVVLAVDRRGRVKTFFLPPTITTGACAEVENNTASGVGCDAVPTGLAYGPGNTLYVSALTSEVPGEGRVYVVDARTGKLRKTISGFSGPTGVAVDPAGNVFVSELLEGFPAGDGPPPDDFDPSTVGQIVKVTPSGKRSFAQVTMPSGLLWDDGSLYASAWSVAGFLGMGDAGQVVSIAPGAFVKG